MDSVNTHYISYKILNQFNCSICVLVYRNHGGKHNLAHLVLYQKLFCTLKSNLEKCNNWMFRNQLKKLMNTFIKNCYDII